MNYTIHVSRACIQNGRRGNCIGCPIALAFLAHPDLVQFGTSWRVRKVHEWSDNWVVEACYGPISIERILLPKIAADFAESFDVAKPVQQDRRSESHLLLSELPAPERRRRSNTFASEAHQPEARQAARNCTCSD